MPLAYGCGSCAICIEGRRLGTSFAGAVRRREAPDLLVPRISKARKGDTVDHVSPLRPFGARLSVGLRTVAFQPRLGICRPFRPELRNFKTYASGLSDERYCEKAETWQNHGVRRCFEAFELKTTSFTHTFFFVTVISPPQCFCIG